MTETKQPGTPLPELAALIEKATDSDLADGGRYFSETCWNFTECGHGDCGEYSQGTNDGELVEYLWNNRHQILDLHKQRDELLAALEAMRNVAGHTEECAFYDGALCDCDYKAAEALAATAISRARGEEG